MKVKLLLPLILIALSLASCSKQTASTQAKIKLNLSGITGLSTGSGAGGVLLFGRNSANGNLFGKVVTGAEENLDLSNGPWVFYALLWDGSGISGTTPGMMNGKVQCAKVAQELKGVDSTISFNLSNSFCDDPEFSEGRSYIDSTTGLKRFADFYLEECDEVNKALSYTCGLKNQGSGLSYRVKFQGFIKSPTSSFVFGGPALTSACVPASSLSTGSFPLNFPSGSLLTPFVLSVETYLGSSTCDPSDPKGVHTVVLNQGLRSQNPMSHKVVFSNSIAFPQAVDFPSIIEKKEEKCEDMLSYLNGSNFCVVGSIPNGINRFAPATEVSTQTPTAPAIKHMLEIPPSFLCSRYENLSSVIGSHPFAGGDGSRIRPYKICNEWQFNQIGELGAPASFATSDYKLMRNLDMNKTDFGPYAKPSCVGVSGSIVKSHHNLNPIGHLFSSCTTSIPLGTYTGRFNGNKKTISHARVSADSVTLVGFVRTLDGGRIFDLDFFNLQVRGLAHVGGVASEMTPSTKSRISNIRIKHLDVESDDGPGSRVAGISAIVGPSSIISDVLITDGYVDGGEISGGAVAENEGSIIRVGYSGEISNYTMSSQKSGGLVAINNTSGTIQSSYTEGFLRSSSHYVGGVVGQNSGDVQDVYSTMSVLSFYSAPSGYAAGILGINSVGGSFDKVYFDGHVTHKGPTPSKHGIFNGTSGSQSKCWSTYNPSTGAAPCLEITPAALRDTTTTTFSSLVWKSDLPNMRPRLQWEVLSGKRPCFLAANRDSVSAQISAGRGSVMNPVTICTDAQFLALEGQPAGRYFVLEEDLNLKNVMTNGSEIIHNFSGSLDGNGHSLYGAQITQSTPNLDGVAIIRVNDGTIKNLSLFANNVDYNNSGATGGASILVADNRGTIKKINAIGNDIIGYNSVGIIAGVNSGILDSVFVDYASVQGVYEVGGLVGANRGGKIYRGSFSGNISDNPATSFYDFFGGIAGASYGAGAEIDQVEFRGWMNFSIQSSYTTINIGGITGKNSGSISNAMTRNYANINSKNKSNIGGLVGYNESTGSVISSLSLGKVVYDNASSQITGGSFFDPLIGENLGTISYAISLENISGAFLGGVTVSSCTAGSGSFSFVSSVPSGSDGFIVSQYSNSDALTNFIPMSSSGPTVSAPSTAPCVSAAPYSFYQLYSYSTPGVPLADIGDFNTYDGFDMAVETSSGNGIHEDRLIEFHVSEMYNRPPTLTPPIWSLGEGDDYPRLLQVNY